MVATSSLRVPLTAFGLVGLMTPLACELPAHCRLLTFTWEFDFSPSDSMDRSRMSLWSAIVVSVQAHGSGGDRCIAAQATPATVRSAVGPHLVRSRTRLTTGHRQITLRGLQ
jgi:hypothetical protein